MMPPLAEYPSTAGQVAPRYARETYTMPIRTTAMTQALMQARQMSAFSVSPFCLIAVIARVAKGSAASMSIVR